MLWWIFFVFWFRTRSWCGTSSGRASEFGNLYHVPSSLGEIFQIYGCSTAFCWSFLQGNELKKKSWYFRLNGKMRDEILIKDCMWNCFWSNFSELDFSKIWCSKSWKSNQIIMSIMISQNWQFACFCWSQNFASIGMRMNAKDLAAHIDDKTIGVVAIMGTRIVIYKVLFFEVFVRRIPEQFAAPGQMAVIIGTWPKPIRPGT